MQKASVARLGELRKKIPQKYWDEDPDTQCTGKGLPAYRWEYSGGTFAENQEVADADRCSKLHVAAELQDYCCPMRPGAGL